ncbi:hypothetical protein VAE151_630397 [Vibrio aestuarianus]|uniref:Uncharacterized protein n=1 Tax=Vibrio aestuarianus TaxID=28171 RepID=A0ABM9FI95_9VIBR|nr:hypothetical protein VAE063_1000395 [Vibrio aestuarianus]CAH8222771.1 hypothetical protein VIBAE_B10484 [Vibrio aestuarianus subsp. francensis]CAH8219604.1 hypothetical protein VAE308_1150343 [Vibrio aestuarianus]CAH8224331.1 hypothetical protein VAE055_420398 [Vibrio aestuarianus]CAH8224357.1 hypothetical protein VAE032_320395 [Vibrio aestuarianus]
MHCADKMRLAYNLLDLASAFSSISGDIYFINHLSSSAVLS